MAEKKIVTTIIDGIEERLPDNDQGWGKYKVYLEGMEGVQKVDVPDELNAEYDLNEGYVVTLIEGPFNWIVHAKSECFTGVPFEDDAPQRKAAPKRSSTPRRAKRPSRASYSKDDTAEAPSKTRRDETRRTHAPRGGRTTESKSDAGAVKHSAWNQYQVDVRDPQMRMQSLLKIASDVHVACMENGADPIQVLDEIIMDAEKLDKDVIEHLGL